MVDEHICPICEETFYRRDLAIEHIKSKHPASVNRILSRLTQRKIERLRKRGIDPQNWATGCILIK